MWTYNGPAKPDSQGHSVLIVGYDRHDTRNPYFIIKNSWGPTQVPGAKGFTYVSYEFLQKYGLETAYITGITQRSWPELRFVGRWALHFDGWEGILDITHVPGVFQGVLNQKKEKTRDQRIGIFFEKDNPSKAFRVNGSMNGNRIDFYIDSKNSNARCDQLGGRHFTYYLSAGDRDLMAGSHHDANGSVWGGYARRLQSDEPRAKPEQVKEAIVQRREFKNIRWLREEVAEFEYRPEACHKTYRMVVAHTIYVDQFLAP
jgi:Papain family cysteine protease